MIGSMSHQTKASYLSTPTTSRQFDLIPTIPDSLLNYYAAAMRLRNENPEIARGESEKHVSAKGAGIQDAESSTRVRERTPMCFGPGAFLS